MKALLQSKQEYIDLLLASPYWQEKAIEDIEQELNVEFAYVSKEGAVVWPSELDTLTEDRLRLVEGTYKVATKLWHPAKHSYSYEPESYPCLAVYFWEVDYERSGKTEIQVTEFVYPKDLA